MNPVGDCIVSARREEIDCAKDIAFLCVLGAVTVRIWI